MVDWDFFSGYNGQAEKWQRYRDRRFIRSAIFIVDFAVLLSVFAVLGVVVYAGWLDFPFASFERKMEGSVSIEAFTIEASILLVLWVINLRAQRLYDLDVRRDKTVLIARIFNATAITFGIASFVATLVASQSMTAFVLFVLPAGLCCLLINHTLLLSAFITTKFGSGRSRVLVFINQNQLQQVRQRDKERAQDDAQIVGYIVVDANERWVFAPNGERLCAIEDHLSGALLQKLDVDALLVLCPQDLPEAWIRRMGWACAPWGVSIHVRPGVAEDSLNKVRASRLASFWTMKISPPGAVLANGVIKRLADIILASTILLILSPVFIVTALLVKLGDGGPIFYKAPRVGKNGSPFEMWKFRSMYVGADKQREALAKATGQSSLLFKMENDPRVTPVGKFIRRYSIDELPQLFNVIGGTMSLVGPRPPLPEEAKYYETDSWMRLTVPPGMTGLWQVSGRSRLTAEQAVALDLLYADNWSLGLDLSIILRTFKAVVGKDGAY